MTPALEEARRFLDLAQSDFDASLAGGRRASPPCHGAVHAPQNVETLGAPNPCAVLFRDDSIQDVASLPLSQADAIAADALQGAEAVISGAAA